MEVNRRKRMEQERERETLKKMNKKKMEKRRWTQLGPSHSKSPKKPPTKSPAKSPQKKKVERAKKPGLKRRREEEEDTMSEAVALGKHNRKRIHCKYGPKCTVKDPRHKEAYAHPWVSQSLFYCVLCDLHTLVQDNLKFAGEPITKVRIYVHAYVLFLHHFNDYNFMPCYFSLCMIFLPIWKYILILQWRRLTKSEDISLRKSLH